MLIKNLNKFDVCIFKIYFSLLKVIGCFRNGFPKLSFYYGTFLQKWNLVCQCHDKRSGKSICNGLLHGDRPGHDPLHLHRHRLRLQHSQSNPYQPLAGQLDGLRNVLESGHATYHLPQVHCRPNWFSLPLLLRHPLEELHLHARALPPWLDYHCPLHLHVPHEESDGPPGVNFNIILQAAFLYESILRSFSLLTYSWAL